MANYFWVGGAGTWDGITNHFATTSGGTATVAAPSSTDTVTFDANSGSALIALGTSPTVASLTSSSSLNTFHPLTFTLTLAGTGTVWSWTAGTYTATSETISITGASPTFAGGGKTYNNVSFTGSGTPSISGINTFATLTRIGTATTTNGLQLQANQTATSFVATGNSTTNRLLVSSNTVGTSRTVTATSVTLTNTDFTDVSGAGAASPFTGTSMGDSQGNTGITFDSPLTLYWVATAGGNYNATSSWSTSSGGSSGARIPLPQDTAVWDANSIATTGKTITINMPRLCSSFNFTGILHSPTLSLGIVTPAIYGDVTFISAMSVSGANVLTFVKRGAFTFNSAGLSMPGGIAINAHAGTLALGSNLVCASGKSVALNDGTFTDAGFSVTGNFSTNNSSNTRVLNQTGAWTLNGTGIIWTTVNNTNLTLNTSGGNLNITDTSATSKTLSMGTGDTLASLTTPTSSSGAIIFNTTGNYTITGMTFGPGTTHTFQSGFKITFTNAPVMSGASGNDVVINSTTGASQHTLSFLGSGPLSYDYLNLTDSKVLQTATWYAGTHSANTSNNSNWIFTAPPTLGTGVGFLCIL